jgi:uncharacterized repeat protein (TIGR03806 family)
MRGRWGGTALFLVGLALLGSCSKKVRVYNDDDGFPDKLSAWGLFVGNPAELKPNVGVVPYDLNTPLFSDYATKRRFVWMPPGTAASYRPDDIFDFPVGTVLSKSFSYPGKGLIETRLLVRTKNGWFGLPYVWNANQTEATLQMAADPVRVSYNNVAFDYMIPNANQCKACHEKAKAMVPLGPKARNLNRDLAYADGTANELAHWTQIGYLKNAPAPAQAPRAAVWNDPSQSLDARARAYFDVNCAHCHNPQGPANTSGLYLTYGQADPLRLGFSKVPVSAGKASGDFFYDVVAGHPEQSILVHRMESTEPKILMPELGRSLVHKEGVELIREWIRSKGRS